MIFVMISFGFYWFLLSFDFLFAILSVLCNVLEFIELWWLALLYSSTSKECCDHIVDKKDNVAN